MHPTDIVVGFVVDERFEGHPVCGEDEPLRREEPGQTVVREQVLVLDLRSHAPIIHHFGIVKLVPR
jgi:hypothetical protein